MMLMTESEIMSICAKARSKWGDGANLFMLIEECAELIVAVNHIFRGRCEISEIMEELADVQIMITTFRTINSELFDAFMEKKLSRLAKRLEGA